MESSAKPMEPVAHWRYGLVAVMVGLAVIGTCFGLALVEYEEAGDVGTALAGVTGTVGAIVGAYFGVHVGSAGKQQAEEHAREARSQLAKEKDKAQALSAALPHDQAAEILERYSF